jgi:hypothetical protein
MSITINADSTNPSINVNSNSILLPTAGGGAFALQSMLGWRNIVHNPNFLFNQRYGGSSVTPTGIQFVSDRWRFASTNASKLTFQTMSTIGTVGSSSYYMRISTASQYTPSANEVFGFEQPIEGDNLTYLNWGTSRALPVTVSFWARVSVTGTYTVALRNAAGQTRSSMATFTMNSTATWEFKTVTFIPDTACNQINGIGTGLRLWFDLGTGTTFQGNANTIYSVDMCRVTGTVGLVSQVNGSYLDITDITMDAGLVALPFQPRPTMIEEIIVKRYYERRTLVGTVNNERMATTGLANGTGSIQFPIQYQVAKRAPPTVVVGNVTNLNAYDGSTNNSITAYSIDNAGVYITNIQFSVPGMTIGRAVHLAWNNFTPLPVIEITSELP